MTDVASGRPTSNHGITPKDQWRGTFRPGRIQQEFYLDAVTRHLADHRVERVLDIGCGTGTLLLNLAERWPKAQLMGIDVSTASVDIARERAAALGLDRRVSFASADYRTFVPGTFDLVMAWSVLALIPASPRQLAAKLANEVVPGGWFMNSGPFQCPYNITLATGRRAARAIRTSLLDWAIFRMATLLHGRDMAPDALQERVEYMYAPPNFWAGALESALEAGHAFEQEKTLSVPHTSIAQLKHRLTVHRRAA